MLHKNANTERVHLPRKMGGRGLRSIKDRAKQAINNINWYQQDTKVSGTDKLMTAVATYKLMNQPPPTNPDQLRAEMEKQRQEKWAAMPLQGRFIKQRLQETEDHDLETSFRWLTKGHLKAPTEALLTAAQDQIITTMLIKKKIYGLDVDAQCRLCRNHVETLGHLITSCSALASRDYYQRHLKICLLLHHHIAKRYGFTVCKAWWRHEPTQVAENDQAIVHFDYQFYADFTACKPDLVIVDKKLRKVVIVDVAVRSDQNVRKKEVEKTTKYIDLKVLLQRRFPLHSVNIVPVVIGALGTLSKYHKQYMSRLGLTEDFAIQLQKQALLGTARTIRRIRDEDFGTGDIPEEGPETQPTTHLEAITIKITSEDTYINPRKRNRFN